MVAMSGGGSKRLGVVGEKQETYPEKKRLAAGRSGSVSGCMRGGMARIPPVRRRRESVTLTLSPSLAVSG